MEPSLPTIERYNETFFRVARRWLPQARDVDVLVLTDELKLVRAEDPIPYRPPSDS